jgi:hypothetical protein
MPSGSAWIIDPPARSRCNELSASVKITLISSAIRAFGTLSAASLLISAQSSKVLTPQSSSAHFHPRNRSVFERRRQAGNVLGLIGVLPDGQAFVFAYDRQSRPQSWFLSRALY